MAELGYRGIFVDANAISPARMHRIIARLTPAGVVAVDGCIFGSPPGGQPPARLYLAGDSSANHRIADLFTGSLAGPAGSPPRSPTPSPTTTPAPRPC
ncbi:MAG TPA: hypothetical protein VFQ77_11870 [Pseudonocardiaceae bacterium]|nr:hypothetical protein [Pseudonocardiaceae bacterium]